MTVQTSAGSLVSIGTTASNPSGDTFTLIGEITDIPEFGPAYQLVTHNPVATRTTQKFRGSINQGSVTLMLGRDLSDAGQSALNTALASDSAYNFRVELNDSAGSHGTRFVFKARIMSFTTNIGQVNNVVTAKVQLEITSAITTTAAA